MYAISIFSIAAWILAPVGVVLILLGLFARRIITRSLPHCAGCGYPLNDVPEREGVIVCPECGRAPQTPTEVYAMRRRKWVVALGVVVFVGALVLPMVPTLRANGWRSVMPMSVQIRMWETADPRTRGRIRIAYRDGSLSDRNFDRLRQTIRGALVDQNLPKQTLIDAVAYIYLSLNASKGNPLLTEQDIAAALSNPAMKTTSLMSHTFSRRSGAPQTPELQKARRLIVEGDDSSMSKDAIGWLLKYPSDDPEDIALVQRLLTGSDDRAFWAFRSEFDDADPALYHVPIALLDDPDPKIRKRALECLSDALRRNDHELSFEDSARVLELLDDPDQDIHYSARHLIEDLPASAEPLIDQLLRETTDPDRLRDLVYSSRRRDPDAIGLTPAMVEISRNRSLPLRTRLDAANAYNYIRARARPGDQPIDMWSAYDDLVDALIEGNFYAAIAYGEEIRSRLNPWSSTAITRRMLDEGVTMDQSEQWLRDRPGVTALLEVMVPDGQDPRERLELGLIKIASSKYTPELTQTEARRAIAVFYPDATIPTPDP